MRKPSPALVISLIALFVALGGAGWAATGGNFILGKSNTADATSSLSALVAGGTALSVSNLNTATGSRALRLDVAPGHRPFSVNSDAKVTTLNADKLDGIESTGCVRGPGRFLANRLTLAPTTGEAMLVIPGLGHLSANCLSTKANITWVNSTGGTVDVWRDSFFTPVGPGGRLLLAQRLYYDSDGRIVALGVGDSPNSVRTAVFDVFLAPRMATGRRAPSRRREPSGRAGNSKRGGVD